MAEIVDCPNNKRCTYTTSPETECEKLIPIPEYCMCYDFDSCDVSIYKLITNYINCYCDFQSEVVPDEEECPQWYCEETASTIGPPHLTPTVRIGSTILQVLALLLFVALGALVLFLFMRYFMTLRTAYSVVAQGAEEAVEMGPIINNTAEEGQAEGAGENSESQPIRYQNLFIA